MKIKCKAIKNTFKKDDFYYFIMRPINKLDLDLYEKDTFTLQGDLSFMKEGVEYELDMEFIKTDNFGAKYKLLSMPNIELEELTDESEFRFLCEITSENQVRNIQKNYPNFIRLILDGKEDEIDVNLIHNVKETRKNFLVREICKKFKYFIIKQNFSAYNLSNTDCRQLGTKYKSLEDIERALTDNPYYSLIEIVGRSFETVDKVILQERPELATSFQRTEHLILHVLNLNQYDGNTRINANEMFRYAKELAPECANLIKEVAINSELIFYDEVTKTTARMDTYIKEYYCAMFIAERLKNSTKLDIDYTKYCEVDGFKLTEQQTMLLKNFCGYSFSLLVGYSGSGKSSSIKALISLLEDNGLSYTLLAPTGTASARLSVCTGRKTSTMHRAICGRKEIISDVVIVDEFSFFGTEWTYTLISAIVNPNTRIVLCGDPAQLPPVMNGKAFDDIIESNRVPKIMLTQVFRYADGGILKVATDIRNGKQFLSNEPYQKFGNDYEFYQTDTPLEDAVYHYTKLIEKGIKPHDIMGLVPFNIGECGTLNINSQIQTVINPPKPNQYSLSMGIKNHEVFFRKGDYVLNTKNNYNALTLEQWEQLQNDNDLDRIDVANSVVYNGDTGYIRNVDEKKLVVEINEEFIVYEKFELQNLLLAYFISTHKSQGQQSKYVINITNPIHNKMLSRELLYVADSRSCGKHIELGDISTINKAIQIVNNNKRDTWLKDLLLKENENG